KTHKQGGHGGKPLTVQRDTAACGGRMKSPPVDGRGGLAGADSVAVLHLQPELVGIDVQVVGVVACSLDQADQAFDARDRPGVGQVVLVAVVAAAQFGTVVVVHAGEGAAQQGQAGAQVAVLDAVGRGGEEHVGPALEGVLGG